MNRECLAPIVSWNKAGSIGQPEVLLECTSRCVITKWLIPTMNVWLVYTIKVDHLSFATSILSHGWDGHLADVDYRVLIEVINPVWTVTGSGQQYLLHRKSISGAFLLLNIFIQDQSMAPPARVRLLPVSQEDWWSSNVLWNKNIQFTIGWFHSAYIYK